MRMKMLRVIPLSIRMMSNHDNIEHNKLDLKKLFYIQYLFIIFIIYYLTMLKGFPDKIVLYLNVSTKYNSYIELTFFRGLFF